MALKLSTRSDIESFRVMDTLRRANERAARGENLIRMDAGQPCFGAPQAALDYARSVLAGDQRQGYTESVGMTLLRDRIAVYYRDTYKHDLDYERIAITTGSSCGFILALLAAFDKGDRVAVTAPTYAAYRNMLKSLDLDVITIETSSATNYQPTAALLENCREKFDGLIINSPCNPTGAMIAEDELGKICAWCDERGVRLISDEAYHGITYETPAQTTLKFSRNTIVLNTFSKYFAMTGWRMGWVIVPPDMADRIKRLAENLYVAPPTLSQHLAYKVFDHLDVLNSYVRQYKENRDILRTELPKAGFEKLSPGHGAFYLYADIAHLTNDSEEFCRRIMDEAKVSACPGLDFDAARGHSTMRFSYAGTPEDMREACRRLKEWLA